MNNLGKQQDKILERICPPFDLCNIPQAKCSHMSQERGKLVKHFKRELNLKYWSGKPVDDVGDNINTFSPKFGCNLSLKSEGPGNLQYFLCRLSATPFC